MVVVLFCFASIVLGVDLPEKTCYTGSDITTYLFDQEKKAIGRTAGSRSQEVRI